MLSKRISFAHSAAHPHFHTFIHQVCLSNNNVYGTELQEPLVFGFLKHYDNPVKLVSVLVELDFIGLCNVP
jgi:hypothetical protein